MHLVPPCRHSESKGVRQVLAEWYLAISYKILEKRQILKPVENYKGNITGEYCLGDFLDVFAKT